MMDKTFAYAILIFVVLNEYHCTSLGTSQNIKIKSNDDLQKVTCYDGKGQTGESLDLVTGAIADLGWGYNFDDKISSCCFQGIWILYEDAAYNIDNHDV